MAKVENKISFEDEIVLYHSAADNCWIGHSLRTDQIGTGEDLVGAMVDVMQAVKQICEAAREDSTLAYLREAPQEIKEIFDSAINLPGEIYEIAHKKVHGEWPEDWSTPNPAEEKPYKVEIKEPVAC